MVLSSAFSVKISQCSSRKDQKQGVRTPREVRVSSKIIEKSYKKISRHHELNKAHLKKNTKRNSNLEKNNIVSCNQNRLSHFSIE